MTKPKAKSKKRNLRSEAAMREAIRRKRKLSWSLDDGRYEVVAYDDFAEVGQEIIAVFDLRDCYRKRQPLKGITKAMRKAVITFWRNMDNRA